MPQPRYGGALDTPRTNIGDATYLSQRPDFADISQEASFQSPGKDGNLLQQLQNGRRGGGINLRTPRRSGPLADRINLPPSIGGAEFTPLLKSATRNSVRRRGKENGSAVSGTPGLGRLNEDEVTLLPPGETSIYTGSRNQSYLDNTLPQVEASSAASTPLALPPRRGGGAVDKGPLQDGNLLSLREQENVIDRIEKENFGLKLKIHFLEEALRKAGPGFSEAALKENTELKVDKVTMQRELHKYKKHLTTAEKDLETYRQQMIELQEKAKRKYADENQRAELEKLQQILEERESNVEELQRQVDDGKRDQDQVEKLQDDIGDLEADLREKDRLISEREDELEDLRDKLEEAEESAKDAKRKMVEMEQVEQDNEELGEAKETIESLELDIRRLEEQLEDAVTKMNDAVSQKDRAEGDLEELQEEMANKSVVTKGLSRQIEEKVARLQEELDQSSENRAILEKELAEANQENDELRSTIRDLEDERNGDDDEKAARLRELEDELLARGDENDTLQSRFDALKTKSESLEQNTASLQKELQETEEILAKERQHALEMERDLRNQYRDEIERLNDEISDLQAEVRERDNLYDNDSEKWETEKQTLEAEYRRAEEKALGLQRTIDVLRETEGSLTDKESKLQAAIASETERHKSEEGVLTRQVEDLQDALETRQTLLTNLRNELSAVRDELRQTQIDYQTQADKVAALEDEVDILQHQMDGGIKRQELEASKRECESLRSQVEELRLSAQFVRKSPSPRKSQRDTEEIAQLRRQLSETTAQLQKATREKQTVQDQLSSIKAELQSVRTSLAEAEAEREELNGQLQQAKTNDNDTLQLDRERLDLRTAKMKLDNEVRRLKEENNALTEQRKSIEQTLEDEIEKAAAEEDRLGQEILQLQSKMRQTTASESGDLASSRRTIRELERRIEDYQEQLALTQGAVNIDGASELSMVRRDLSDARQKELEFVQRESAHRDAVKGLKRQIADLERQVHNDEISRLIASPASTTSDSARRRTEVSGLRQQLTSAQQSISDFKSKARDAERTAAEATKHLQSQLDDLEDQKIVLEEVLEEARQQAEETAAAHEQAMRLMKRKLDKLERARANASEPVSSSSDRNLRKSQAEIENLEHDVRYQQETIDALVASEGSLRRKLERARSERAAYRMTAEKLQRDIQKARKNMAPEQQRQRAPLTESKTHASDDQAIETVVRAAQGAEERHQKELKGMVMQMEWMQARWEREASLRSDAAFAKRFLQLQLDVANAWYVFPLSFDNSRFTALTHKQTATKLNSASWSTSAPTSSATGNTSSRPQPSRSSRPGQTGPLCGHSSQWPDSSPACASRPGGGPSRRRCGRSLCWRRRRCASRRGRGSSRWCVSRRRIKERHVSGTGGMEFLGFGGNGGMWYIGWRFSLDKTSKGTLTCETSSGASKRRNTISLSWFLLSEVLCPSEIV